MEPQLAALALVDACGSPIYAQAYDPGLRTALPAYLQGLLGAVARQLTTVSQLYNDSRPIIYKRLGGLVLFVVGTPGENELLLCDIVAAVGEAIGTVVDGVYTPEVCRDNYARLCVALSQVVDSGYYLSETPPELPAEKGFVQTAAEGLRFIVSTLTN